MKNKVYINGRFLTQQLFGVQRFCYEITKQIIKISNLDIIVLIPSNAKINKSYSIDFKVQKVGVLCGHLWEQITLPIFLYKNKSPLLLNFSNSAPAFYINKFITIHDLSIYNNKSGFKYYYVLFYKILIPKIIKNSIKIITVSNTSKTEIINKFKLNKKKILTVYNGVSKDFISDNISLKKENYILFVGSLSKRKNLLTLLKAMNYKPNLTLKIVGITVKDFNKTFSRKRKYDNIECLGYMYGPKLVNLYRKALMLVVPSYYEGFGIPLIEALSLGCPVIASDIDVFHEVCNDSVLYFNPSDCEDLLSQINLLLNNEILINRNIESGYSKIKNYNWIVESNKIIKEIKIL